MHVICRLALLLPNILSLSLIFVSLNTICLGVFLLGFNPAWDSVLSGLG